MRPHQALRLASRPPGLPGGPRYPFQPSGWASRLILSFREGLSPLREGLPTPPALRERLPTNSRPSGRTSLPPPAHRKGLQNLPSPPRRLCDPYPPSRRDSQPLPMLREGLPTSVGHLGGYPDPYQPFRRDSLSGWLTGTASRTLPALRKGLPTPTHPPERTSAPGMAARPLSALQEGLPTPADATGGPPNSCRSPGRVSRPLSAFPPGPLGGRHVHSRPCGLASRPLLALWEGLPSHPRPPGGPPHPSGSPGETPDHFQPSGRAFQRILALQEGLPTLTVPFRRASQPLPASRKDSDPYRHS